MLVNQSRLVNS